MFAVFLLNLGKFGNIADNLDLCANFDFLDMLIQSRNPIPNVFG